MNRLEQLTRELQLDACIWVDRFTYVEDLPGYKDWRTCRKENDAELKKMGIKRKVSVYIPPDSPEWNRVFNRK